jgi:hypothetical protein
MEEIIFRATAWLGIALYGLEGKTAAHASGENLMCDIPRQLSRPELTVKRPHLLRLRGCWRPATRCSRKLLDMSQVVPHDPNNPTTELTAQHSISEHSTAQYLQ